MHACDVAGKSPGRWSSPRHQVPLKSRHEGPQSVSGVDNAAGSICQALFLGFRGGDGAPVFAADVTGRA
jgi:hypothetical protein